MARVTVEDCVVLVPNRFNLVMYAAHRARALASGAELLVDRDRDKNPVVALREIAEERLELPSLRESLVKGMQKHIEPDRPEEEEVAELMTDEEQGWISKALADASDDNMGGEGAEGGFSSAASFEDVDVRD